STSKLKKITIEIKNFVPLIKTKIMDLEARKISFVQEFLRLQNEEIISVLEKMLRQRKTELIEKSLKPMSMEQYNNEIDQALDDSKNGRIIKASELKTKIQKWD
ncbi:MAG: hypothetical protein V1783_11895, partial [Bacteroidota bacterium]